MPTYIEKQKSNFEPIKAGTYLARIYSLIQLGNHQEEVKGKPMMLNKLQLSFELPMNTKVFKEGTALQPLTVHKKYTWSLGQKANLRKVVEAIVGVSLTEKETESFDIESLIGKPCLVAIKEVTSKKGNIYNDISTVSPCMIGQTCPPQVNPSRVLTFSSWNQEIFDSLPDFLKDQIMTSEQWESKFTHLDGAERDAVIALKVEEAKKDIELETYGEGEIDPSKIAF